MDKAYLEAEAVLDDDAARAARRARVLAAVAREATPAQATASARRPAWGRARWLAAAGVAGLGLLVVTQIYRPAQHQPPIAPSAAPAPAAQAAASSGPPAPAVGTPAPPAPAVKAVPPPSGVAAQAAPPVLAPTIAPPTELAAPPPPPPPPPAAMAASPRASPADEAAAPPPASSDSVVVTAERRQQRLEKVPVAVSTFSGQSRDAAPAAPSGGLPADQAASLRAAAAAGRAADIEGLLAKGVPVDAADAAGETALMKSVQADHPAAAAVLRRHGASLDRRDNAGESARDMAASKDDSALDRALGVGR